MRVSRYGMQRFGRMFCISLLLALANGTSFGITVDRVLATVNNEVVTLSDYKSFVAKADQAADREIISEYYLKKLIEEKLILQEAKKAGIEATEEEIVQSLEDFRKQSGLSLQELEKRLNDEGMTMAEYRTLLRENLIALKIVDKEVNARVIVNPADINRYYENNLNLFLEKPEKVLVKAIYVKLSNNATLTEITDLKIKSLRISAELRKGEPFEKLAMQHTDDSLRRRDAVLGEFERGTMIPVLEEKIFSLKEGEISEPVWTKDGFYILKVVRRTEAVYTPLEKVRDRIQAKAYEQKREEKFNEWMKRLWETSSVSILQQ
jgi:parvulin-like peptidyl-prolyl isomerase